MNINTKIFAIFEIIKQKVWINTKFELIQKHWKWHRPSCTVLYRARVGRREQYFLLFLICLHFKYFWIFLHFWNNFKIFVIFENWVTRLHFWICLLFWKYVQTVWNYWNNETISIFLLFLYYSKLFDMFDIFFKKFVIFEIMLFFVYFCYFWIIKQKYCYFWKIMFLVIVYFVRRSLVIGCLPCICKAGLRPAFFIMEHVSGVCVLRLAISCHCILVFFASLFKHSNIFALFFKNSNMFENIFKNANISKFLN